MSLELGIPLAESYIAPAIGAAATFVVGGVAHIAQQVHGFRAPLPPLPQLTGRAGEATLQEMIADAIAGARIPVAMPPSPLGPRGNLAGLAVQALAWAWGQLNGRKPVVAPEWSNVPEDSTPQAHWEQLPPGGYNWRVLYAGQVHTNSSSVPSLVGLQSFTSWITTESTGLVVPYVQAVQSDGSYTVCAARTFALDTCLKFQAADNPTVKLYRLPPGGSALEELSPSEIYNPELAVGTVEAPITPEPMTFAPDQYPEPLPPLPLPYPAPSPQVEPQPDTEPQTLPAPSPLVPITPGPVAPPVVKPAVPVTPRQPKVPAPTATNNGTLVQPLPQPVPTTPKDAVFPVPGGLPVTGRAIPPTMAAVAQEVGRIEQKIDRMVNPKPGQWGNVPSAGDLLKDNFGSIIEAIFALTGGTTYTMDSPCEVDEETGAMLPPVEVEAPGSINAFGLIVNRLDALAVLLQVHKNLKQPNCKPKQPTGEFVTVNFEEIN